MRRVEIGGSLTEALSIQQHLSLAGIRDESRQSLPSQFLAGIRDSSAARAARTDNISRVVEATARLVMRVWALLDGGHLRQKLKFSLPRSLPGREGAYR